MRVLIDIVHPADVLFFKHPIDRLMAEGHDVKVVSRHKDVTCELLDKFGIAHTPVSTAKKGVFGLAYELIARDIALLREVRKFKPDVMAGFGGVGISHVGTLLRIPSLSFYDTEKANLQHLVTLPFITHMFVPESYDGKTAKGRTSTFPGTKDFSYLHKDNFVPSKNDAIQAGLDETKDNYFIRLVAWNANHDFGVNGWNPELLRGVIRHISDELGGHVHISSEEALPSEFDAYLYKGEKHKIHHLLAHCKMYIGESATMAGEAAILGVPVIYAANDQRGYTDDLSAQGLAWLVTTLEQDTICDTITTINAIDADEWQQRFNAFYCDKMNLSDFVIEQLHHYSK